ncbi:hypothetical protein DFP95_1067 [Cohnella lupini]|uniref:Uncharacterized protein n=1 Tax=Cohnella lupini TaxID=1294267 RepID=A0A3D9IEN5_9BACL|nr:hypothetical protein DFP95_1067 [Cohnella lupini]
MLNHDHDLKNLSKQRQAEWEQRITNEAEVINRPSSSRWYQRLMRKSSQKKKGCEIPSILESISRP